MSARARLFIILFLAGFAGVLSFQLVDLAALISILPGGWPTFAALANVGNFITAAGGVPISQVGGPPSPSA